MAGDGSPSQWIGIALDTSVSWPTDEQRVSFEGHEIVFRPLSDETAPAVTVDYRPPMTWREAYQLLRRFLSALAWAEGRPVREAFHMGGGARLRFGHSLPGLVSTESFIDPRVAEPTDPKSRLALALYREAIGVNSVPYQFLGFFKIINVLHDDGFAQKDWIRDALSSITAYEAKIRLAELAEEVEDIANYLYGSGRCAVAHAHASPVVDPDSVEDSLRLTRDLPVIKALAEHLIERDLRIPRRREFDAVAP